MKAKDFVRHEFIGLGVVITDSSSKDNIGIKGKVVNETRNMLIIETDKGEKRCEKSGLSMCSARAGTGFSSHSL